MSYLETEFSEKGLDDKSKRLFNAHQAGAYRYTFDNSNTCVLFVETNSVTRWWLKIQSLENVWGCHC